jgi:class 3 adenylate cyclase
VLQRFLDRSYGRLGARYPARAVFLLLLGNVVVILVVTVGLSLYVGMSTAQFVRLVLIGWAIELGREALAIPLIRRTTGSIVDWIEGDRSRVSTAKAWEAAVSLPWTFMKNELLSLPLGAYVPLVTLAWCFAFAWQLSLSASSALLLFLVAMVYLAYSFALRFFALERVVRPVVDDIARHLPDDEAPRVRSFSLRVRLLAALPAINVVTAVAAYGLVRGGDADLGDLALLTLVATAVAASISLMLTLLVSDSVTRPIVALRGATERVGAGDFGARVPLVTTDETGDLTRSFNRMAEGLAERERIRDAFGTYVDREVAKHILREGTSLAGEEVDVSLMFIDIRDFTGFAARSTAPEVVAAVNRLWELVVPIIHAHSGHVDKFIGDGLLAVFGAPRRVENHADAAVRAAVEISEAVEQRVAGELEIGVGLNSGRVVAGNVGGAGRLEFSVIGDAVNIAARVEAATRQTGDRVLLAAPTRALLSDAGIALVERPGVAITGKREKVAVFAVCDQKTVTAASAHEVTSGAEG